MAVVSCCGLTASLASGSPEKATDQTVTAAHAPPKADDDFPANTEPLTDAVHRSERQALLVEKPVGTALADLLRQHRLQVHRPGVRLGPDSRDVMEPSPANPRRRFDVVSPQTHPDTRKPRLLGTLPQSFGRSTKVTLITSGAGHKP